MDKVYGVVLIATYVKTHLQILNDFREDHKEEIDLIRSMMIRKRRILL